MKLSDKAIFSGNFVSCKTRQQLEIGLQAAIGVDENGKIAFVEKNVDDVDALARRFGWESFTRIEAEETQFFCPGFIDTHIHAPQYPNAGIFGKSTLLDWLEKYTFPMESSLGDLVRAETVYGRCLARTLSYGTTTAAFFATLHTESTNLLADLCLKQGQRAFIGRCCVDRLSPDHYRDASPEAAMAQVEATIAHVKAIDPHYDLISPIITPRFAPACTSALLEKLGKLHQDTGLPIQTHIAETTAELDLVRALFPDHSSYAGVYDDHGLLTSKTVLAHAIHLSDEERKLIRRRGAKISHCPTSNSALSSGMARVRSLLDAGIDVGLGTDISGGYSASILEAMRQACLVSRQVAITEGDEAKLSIEELLYMATCGGAKVLGLEKKVGTFEVGMEWDAQLIDLSPVNPGLKHSSEWKGPVDIFGWEIFEEKIAKWIFNGDDRNVVAVWVRVNATTFVLIILLAVSTAVWVVRYRFLNVYARLPPEPQRKEPQIDLFPDTHDSDSKPGLANYLDEFLSAIKVFGYLERPVFHELTRTMQTRKLRAGETLLLEEEKGFCLVVDGLVQIFAKSGRNARASSAAEDDDDYGESEGYHTGSRNQGYSLLTEVTNGAPMSSLFSILSLFTEDVQLRHQEEDELHPDPLLYNLSNRARRGTNLSSQPVMGSAPGSVPISPLIAADSPFGQASWHEPSSSAAAPSTARARLPDIPPLSLDSRLPHEQQKRQSAPSEAHVAGSGRARKAKSVHPDILARATVDTTIAIIPASAFRRLTRVYPKATAHIVQVILTRLQRVTLATGHSYLGLTSEILQTEKRMNDFTTYDLPNFLRGRALDRLKQKFLQEKERLGTVDGSKGIALHNAGKLHGRRTSGLKEAGRAWTLSATSRPSASHQNSPVLPKMEPYHHASGPSPADLLAAPLPGASADVMPASDLSRSPLSERSWQGLDLVRDIKRGPGGPSALDGVAKQSRKHFVTSPAHTLHRQESLDEDGMFRVSVVECMLKAIGLAKGQHAAPRGRSPDQSPKLVSYDSKRQVAVFNNAFGWMDSLDSPGDGDSESAVSATPSAYSMGGAYNSTNIVEMLRDDVEIVYFSRGSILVEQGERNPGLYYVIDGFLEVGMPVHSKDGGGDLLSVSASPVLSHSNGMAPHGAKMPPYDLRPRDRAGRKKAMETKSRIVIKPGGVAGYVGSISFYRSFVDVRAQTDVYVGFLPRSSLERIIERVPLVLLTMAKRLTTLLPQLILHIDFALEWLQVDAGQVIYHQKDESDAIYLVLNGRLRSILRTDGGETRVLGEYGQGESVGELEVMTESARPGTLQAIRDTELAKFPKTLFNTLAFEHPEITIKISKLIASRMRALVEDRLLEGQETSSVSATRGFKSTVNLRTVAILPVTAGVPVVEFGSRLMSALQQIGAAGGVTSLHQAAILNHLGRHAFNRMGKLKLSQYLADVEERYGMVLYVADTNVNTPWTQTCITQADCILLVGLAEDSPEIGEYERFLMGMKTTARKELVLLHVDRYSPPGLTRKWLGNRNGMWIIGSHHHIQMDFRTRPGHVQVHPQPRRFGSALKQRVQILQAEIQKYTSRRVRQMPLYSSTSQSKGDFHRLGRRLCGKSVGLVLGGGGARGIAHIGIIRALEEAGIPIDIVGGTSIGAFIGALYARDADVVPMYGRAKKFAGRMGSFWRFAMDLTYPSASYTTGHEFNRGIFKTFGDSQIEDSWLEFFCNTTNISKSRAEYHSRGYVWRYVRASMSLAGLLPPLCDEGDLLLDGGYLDNLTVAHMKSLGADIIIAVDVGSIDDNTPQQFGDSLSGFWASFNRWNPFSPHPNPPTLSEIQARLAYVSSVDALERAKKTPGCLYFRPPIEHFGTLEFGRFEEIYQVGYRYGKAHLGQLRSQGVFTLLEETEEKKNLRRTMAPRRASI
ncbi:MAG: Neuropathy target esterase [Phylliscum demangeonii]|nr:MAG: Neuropathy target esterase [Phylliscum demangeonii]